MKKMFTRLKNTILLIMLEYIIRIILFKNRQLSDLYEKYFSCFIKFLNKKFI